MLLKRIITALQWLCCSLSFFLPAIIVANFTLNHFYVNGGYVYDSGWLSYLSTHAAYWPLINPTFIGGTFFDTHMSFIFYLYFIVHNLFSWVGASLPSPVFFSITQGFWFGLLSLSAYGLFLPLREKRKSIHVGLAFIFSLLVLANGVSISIMAFPHFEIGISASLIAFFSLWANRYQKLCYIPLICGLMIREDAGLHYGWVFILLAVTFYFFEKNKKKKYLSSYFVRLAILCIAYAAVIITLQTLFFHSTMLSKIYLGSPAFHHITWSFVKHRLLLITLTKSYIYAPLIISAVLAYRRRDILQSLGVFFVIPWITFSFFAVTTGAGILESYYAFLTPIALLWTAITYGLAKETAVSMRSYISYWKDGSIVLASSTFSFIIMLTTLYYLFLPTISPEIFQKKISHFFGFEWAYHWKNNQQALDTIFSANLLGQNFVVDSAVAAIEIDKITQKNFYERPTPPSKVEAEKIDVMLYLPNSMRDDDMTKKIISMADLNITCSLPGSSYHIAKKTGTHPELC